MTVFYDPSQPIPVRVTRYRCPHCARSVSSKRRCRQHMGRCWYNPAAKGCKTCKHFAQDTYFGETCDEGVDLSARPACSTCQGGGYDPNATWDSGENCPDCLGDGAEVKGGPIVHCDKWEAEE